MNIPYYTNESTGFAMISGVALIQSYSGSTGIVYNNVTGGWGQVYGIYWNTGNISIGLAAHTTGMKIPPTPTGVIYYPKTAPLSSGINLYFFITALSGVNNQNTLSTTGAGTYRYLLTGTDSLTGLNCEYYSTGSVIYNGPSGVFRPSGYLLHKESFAILPNYAIPSALTSTDIYDYSLTPFIGGIYPAMLSDNIININLEITWSGDCGDAGNCS